MANTRKLTKAIVGMIVIGGAAGYFLYEAVNSSWAYYYSVDEFVDSLPVRTSQKYRAEASEVDGNRIIRLAGRVKTGSIVYETEKKQLAFELAGQRNSVRVRYYGEVPKNFEDEKEVVVEGKIGINGAFFANRILTKCESKYKARH